LSAPELMTIVQRQCGASGVTNLEEMLAEARSRNLKVKEKDLTQLLNIIDEFEFLDDQWIWHPKGKLERNRLRNVTRRMLSVTSRISVSSLREGVRREYTYRRSRGLGTWPLLVPPKHILSRFYEQHAEFSVDEFGYVESTEPLSFQIELQFNEQVLVEVFRSTPAGVLDRSGCANGCIKRGMNQNTFNLYMTYSPVVEHLGTDLWTLRGSQVDPAAVQALRDANAMKPPVKRVLDHGWNESGSLWVAVRIPQLFTSFVFGIPAAIRHLLDARSFKAVDENNSDFGTIRILDDGTSIGYGKFLRQRGADENDVLVVFFDLIGDKAELRLGNDEILESLDPET